jgi:hypothetical protein
MMWHWPCLQKVACPLCLGHHLRSQIPHTSHAAPPRHTTAHPSPAQVLATLYASLSARASFFSRILACFSASRASFSAAICACHCMRCTGPKHWVFPTTRTCFLTLDVRPSMSALASWIKAVQASTEGMWSFPSPSICTLPALALARCQIRSGFQGQSPVALNADMIVRLVKTACSAA